MASTPKQANGKLPPNNGSGAKRKKSRSRGSYLTNWLDRTMSHLQESTPSSEMYDTFLTTNWPGGSQFAPGYDPYKNCMYGPEPLSLPSLPTYYNPMVPPLYPDHRFVQNENKGIQVQRPRPRRRSENKAEEVSSTPADTSTSQSNYLQPKNFTDSQDFASLPPIVTSMPDTNSNSEQNDKEEINSAGNARRFSDPCVRGLPDVARPANGDVDSNSESGSGLSGSQVGSRLLTCLLDQITTLKIANERLSKDLQETKAELEAVRQQGCYFPKGPNNVGAASNLNGMGGQYSPGFLTDLVREIRDAARMREEAMYARLRAMLLERTDSGLASAESKLAERTLEEIKSSLRASEADKRRMMDRIVKLEDELRVFRLATGLEPNESRLNGNAEDAECDRLRLRRELADARRAKINAEEHALKLEPNESRLNGNAEDAECDRLRLRRELADARRAKINAEEHALKLEPNESRLNGNAEDAECDRLRLRRELADARRAKINAEEHALKLERLVTQLRSKFNGLQITNGPDSLPSDSEHDPRTRRTSNSTNNSTNNLTNNLPNNLANSTANSTVVFGPVTDL